MARAVLPIEGRAARMIKSPFCKPRVKSSNSVKPVGTPVTFSGDSEILSNSSKFVARTSLR